MSEWNREKLIDVIDIIGGGTPKRSEKEYWNGNIPWLSVTDFNNDFRYVFSSAEHITELGLTKSSTKLLDKDQLIISARGTVGCIAQLSKPMAFNQSCYGLNGKKDILDNGFLYYFLKNNIGLIKSKTHGSVFDTITRNTFEKIEICYPELKEQKEIAEILGLFDQKIHLNTQINQTLEQIAQATFKSWFIEFDPVHAKANALANGETEAEVIRATMEALTGKTSQELDRLQTENPTVYEQFYTLAQAFPSEFEDVEEYGKVPKGWEIVSITDKRVCKVLKPKINLFAGEKDYIATANVSGNSVVGTLEKITYEKRPSRANMQPIIDSIWFAKMVGEHKAIMIDKNDDFLLKNTILSTGFLGIKPEKNKKSFLYCFINGDYFIQIKNQLATGAVQIALNNTSFSKIEIILPSDEILKFFEDKISDLFSTISQNQRNSKLLAEIRDLLLPKLLNGEI